MKNIKIQCSACSNTFLPTNKMLHEHKQTDGFIEVYYCCPKCKERFHVCFHDAETKRLQKAIVRTEKSGRPEKSAELKVKLKEALDRINGKEK